MGNNGEGHADSGNVGRVLNGRYQLIGVVGSGGMAHVYKARDNILGRVVAVKLLRDQYAGDAQFVARFRREAQAAANLAHPNIVNVYDVGQDGDLYYIVMEYINGESLKEYIHRTAPVPINKAVAIAVQILAGVEYAHRSGLIHRDIKPQNVLITPDGTIKVTDFGIAKSVSDLGLTEAGLALGTAHYFSPEQAKGERVVPQSDIYAVGVTLFEMLAGRLPFESENVMGLAFKHITEDAPPVRSFNPSVPPRLEAIVTKSLAKDPQQRFGSAAEMEKALKAMQAGGRQATMEVPVAQVNTQGNRNRGQRGVPPAQARGGTGRLGSQTSTFRPGQGPRGTYAIGGAGAGGGTIATTRQVGNPLAAPTSMAVAPSLRAESGGSGCTIAAIALITLGFLALLAGAVIFFGPKLPSIFSPDVVIPSPTSTPVIPTNTPTYTPVPPTNTPTVTPTNTATPTATPISVEVPKLVGLRIQDAVTLAKQSGFVVVQLDTIDSEQWPQGVVAQQNPNDNTLLKKTSVIAVRVSRGPPAFKLPNLANTDPAAAETVLTGTGLTVTVKYEGNPTIPKGVVTRTDPPADTNVKPGDRVVLWVSRGPTSRIPDLHGMENSDLAGQRLESLNLQVGTITEVDDPTNSVPPGAVISTDPPAGTEVEQNTVVNITISRKSP